MLKTGLLTQPMKPGKARSLLRKPPWSPSEPASEKTVWPDSAGVASFAAAVVANGSEVAGRMVFGTRSWADAVVARTVRSIRLCCHFMKRLLSAPVMAMLGTWRFEFGPTDSRPKTPFLYRTFVNRLHGKLGKNPRGKRRRRCKSGKGSLRGRGRTLR